MTKEATLKDFFSSFGLPAYPAASVPADKEYPYLTYEVATDSFYGSLVSLTVNLWYYATGDSTPNAKARELSERIGMGGLILKCDDGFVWIKRGSPWCQNVRDPDDPNIKRRYINVIVEYLTKN